MSNIQSNTHTESLENYLFLLSSSRLLLGGERMFLESLSNTSFMFWFLTTSFGEILFNNCSQNFWGKRTILILISKKIIFRVHNTTHNGNLDIIYSKWSSPIKMDLMCNFMRFCIFLWLEPLCVIDFVQRKKFQ